MTTEAVSAEGDILARAYAVSDLSDLAEMITMIISKARSARVDQAPLAGLATAARALTDDDWVSEAMKGSSRDRYPADAEMFEAIRDALEHLRACDGDIADALDKAHTARKRARNALRLAQLQVAAAMARPVRLKCDGCHDARRAAIDEAQQKTDQARNREALAAEAVQVIKEAKIEIAQAMEGLRRVPEDYEEFYAEALKLVRADPQALPKDTDFLTGYGSRLMPRKVTGPAAELIRRALKPGPGTDDRQ